MSVNIKVTGGLNIEWGQIDPKVTGGLNTQFTKVPHLARIFSFSFSFLYFSYLITL